MESTANKPSFHERFGSILDWVFIRPPVGHPYGLMSTTGPTPATREEAAAALAARIGNRTTLPPKT